MQQDNTLWDQRWKTRDIPWDLDGPTPALVDWLKINSVKGKEVLVPGCGLGHDAHLLASHGARVVAVDIAQGALDAAAERHPNSPVVWTRADVTALPFQHDFDLAWEYTCFCALPLSLRDDYRAQLARALKSDGTYLGMVFRHVPNPESGPPFQIPTQEFKTWLDVAFNVTRFIAPAPQSVGPRAGNEIWFEAQPLHIDNTSLT